jgi:uncharacterized caspase-like protein
MEKLITKRWLLSLIIIILILVITTPNNRNSCNYADQDYWFLIVGVGEDPNADYQVKYGAHDARELSNAIALKFNSKRIKLLSNSNASKQNILDTITDWLAPQETSESEVVIYFSAHGNANYICPYDSIAYSNENNISITELDQALERLESENIILILDVCYSYNFATGLKTDNVVIFTGCSENQVCWESETLKNGVFSFYLIEALKEPGKIDQNIDNKISIYEVYNFIDDSHAILLF